MAIDSRLEPGRIVHYPTEYGPHFIVLADCRENHFRYFMIRTKPSPHQKKNKELLKHFVRIEKSKFHPFLEYDSLVYCGELHALRIFDLAQHVRVKPKEVKTKISDEVRKGILKVVGDKTLKLLSDDDREGVLKYLG